MYIFTDLECACFINSSVLLPEEFPQKQVDILISKNQALQILYLKHIKLHKLATMDRNPRKFNPHKQYCTVLLLVNKAYLIIGQQILTRIISRFLISYALFN